jgi:hypothetical protein
MSKKKKSSGKGLLIFLAVVVLVAIVGIFLLVSLGRSNYDQASLDAFASCITEKGAVMYGTFWCPHCANTKKKFGSSFSFIEYVECDPNGEDEQSEFCIEKEILQYDTWEFADGSRLISEPSFEDLSSKTGCTLPEEK